MKGRPIFAVSREGKRWKLSIVLLVSGGAGASELLMADGTIPSDIPEPGLDAEAMKRAQKWLRSQVNNIEAEWEP